MLYIKQSVHVANTETFQPQKRGVPPGCPRKKFLVEPGGTPLFCGGKVSVLATRTLCLMYSMAKVGKC